MKSRKVLTGMDIPLIDAIQTLVDTASKDVLIDWALDYAGQWLLPLWLTFDPHDQRPGEALAAARRWQEGVIKLPQARPFILACHAAAREAAGNPAAQAAARAIGHAASVIHSKRHAMGLPLYGALALAYDKLGADAPWDTLVACASSYCEEMRKALEEKLQKA